jgi:hypothetical protein
MSDAFQLRRWEVASILFVCTVYFAVLITVYVFYLKAFGIIAASLVFKPHAYGRYGSISGSTERPVLPVICHLQIANLHRKQQLCKPTINFRQDPGEG